jgi:glycosyltransferase involved in cell wall biosynthesis
MRGGERTFCELASCWPDAPVYTLLCNRDRFEDALGGHRVTVSGLQRLNAGQRTFRSLLPLFPAAAARLPVDAHDLVVSSSSAFAHGVRPRPGAVHVCYCHTPFRYAWHERGRTLREQPPPLRPALGFMLERMRRWDREAAGRVTHYVANSQLTRRRINDSYGRDAAVVHPPVDVERFTTGEPEDFFIVVTELVAHKRVDLALAATERAGKRVKVVGGGPELKSLSRRFAGTAEFLGRVSDSELTQLMPRALALLTPNTEEFGIAAVEAQAAGRPVVAVDAGGVRETVIPGETGILVPPGSVDAFAEALRHTDFTRFSTDRIAAHAAQFSPARFRAELEAEVARAYAGLR